MKDFVRIHKRAILLGLAAALVVAASIGGTLAWLTSAPSGLINTFEPGKVPNKVVETFDEPKTTKSNVMIQNIGNVPAYIRVALVPVWRNADGETGTGIKPILDTNYTMALNIGTGATQWTKGVDDDFYYYNSAVEPGLDSATINLTGILVTSCAPKSPLPADCVGKRFELNVISQSIQAEGMGVSTAQDAFEIAEDASAGSNGLPTP